MFDLIVRGGRMAHDALAARSVAITDGKVAALLDPGDTAPARQSIDAHGCIVFPGLVDAHVHFREPGLTHKEDFESGSRAAALGGVTTVMVMPTDSPMTQTREQFEEKRRLAEGRCHVDFALQALLAGDTRDVEGLAAAGAASFEIFMGLLPEALCLRTEEALAGALAAVRAAGGVAGVTALDERRSASFAPQAEAEGIACALRAHAAAGGRMHLRQVSSAAALAPLRGAPPGVTSEVTPHNLLLTAEALERLGAVAKVVPPLRAPADTAALQRALADARVSIVATDHAPHTPAEKDLGLAKAPGGFPGVQTMLPLLLKLVADGSLTYEALVRVACAEPARIFGLYPRKGALQAGSDADLVIVDPARAMRIRNADQASKAARTPFDGWEIPATPVMTMLRGAVVMRGGAIAGSPRGLHLKPRRDP
jgi:dihydroorotase